LKIVVNQPEVPPDVDLTDASTVVDLLPPSGYLSLEYQLPPQSVTERHQLELWPEEPYTGLLYLTIPNKESVEV